MVFGINEHLQTIPPLSSQILWKNLSVFNAFTSNTIKIRQTILAINIPGYQSGPKRAINLGIDGCQGFHPEADAFR